MKIIQLTIVGWTFFLSGCGVGYNYALFMTKSNVGIDIDSRPPTAELSISRREGVIEPGFENGQTLPVAATFKAKNTTLTSFFFGVNSMFSGGRAASILASCVQKPSAGEDCKEADGGELTLSKRPEGESFLGYRQQIPEAGTIRPFVFGTDTTFGFKVSWSGLTAQYPDSLKLGFNRKEFAFAPISGREGGCRPEDTEGFCVSMPSFLSGIDQSVASQWLAIQYDATYMQFFATGSAAEYLASDPNIVERMKNTLKPQSQDR